MKAHIGLDRQSGIVHTVVSTAANESDISRTAALLHGSETQVHADAGYLGIEKREEIKAADPEGKIDWQIAKRRQPIRKIEDGPEKDGLLAEEKKRKPRCGRLSNIRSTSSRISSDIARHATGAWRKTTINCKSSSGWAISWSPPAKWRERGPQTAE
jgi:IS5 family transposase